VSRAEDSNMTARPSPCPDVSKRPPLGALCVWRVFLMAGAPPRPIAPRVVATSRAAARHIATNAMSQTGMPVDRVLAARLLGPAATWDPAHEARR
jgi:hypothetical protein